MLVPCKQSQYFLTLLSLRYIFSVGQFRSKILALPGFGNFSVGHARSFHDNGKYFNQSSLPLTGYKECMFKRYMGWNASSLHMFERFT